MSWYSLCCTHIPISPSPLNFKTAVKTAFYDLCGQRPPAFYDRNSMHGNSMYRKVSVVGDYLPNVTSDCQTLHAQSHSPAVYEHNRVHMYLVVGLYKLGTTYCVNFEQQRCKITVYTALPLFGKRLPLLIGGEGKC